MPSHSSRRRLWTLAAAAVALLAASLVLLRDPLPAPATVETLRLALPDLPHAGLLHIAAAKGYFADEGLDVTIVPASHGKAAMEELRQGKADFAAMADVVFLLSVMRGEELGVVASVLSVSNDNAVVARRDRNIAAPLELAGKKIGVGFGTSGEYFLWAFLVRHKLAPEAVTLVDVPPREMAQTLAAGAVDAVVTWQPIVLATQAALGDKAVSFAAAKVYTLGFLLVGREDFLKQHPKAMEKLVRALLKAEEFNRSHPEDALNLVAARLRVEVEVLRSTWKDFDFRVDLRQSQLVTLEDQARWAMARGHVAGGPVPNLLPQLHLDALRAARPERVGVLH
jgi:NitT/TauT family transport system substrate-binding protein